MHVLLRPVRDERLIGGRSGNRGRCAQPCRLPYTAVGGKKGNPYPEPQGQLHGRLPGGGGKHGRPLFEAGGPHEAGEVRGRGNWDYDRLLREHRAPTAAEAAELEAAFSRSGFTDGYWQGRTGKDMFGTRPTGAADPKDLFDAAKTAYEKGDLRTVAVDFPAPLPPVSPVP